MHDPVSPDTQARIRQAFVLGLARNPVAAPAALAGLLPDGDHTLALLALTGQRARFAAPGAVAGPVPDAARALHEDPRPILTPPARRALDRLSRSVEKSLAATVMPIALRRVGAAGMRPHPFDLPALARYIRADPENQGQSERAYIALIGADAGADEQTGLFSEGIGADNWTVFPPAQRRLFVAAVRRADPAAGRALLEGVWKTEPAAVRAVLLDALATGLGPDDRPFLDGLAGDRAQTVREIADRLARLAAAGTLKERLAAAAQCFKRAGGVMAALGLGGAGLSFSAPGGRRAKVEDLNEERQRLFAGLALEALAREVGATPAEVMAALPEDEHLVRTLLMQSVSGDAATLQSIAAARLLAITTMPVPVIRLAAEARVAVDPATAARFLAGSVWTKALADLAGSDDNPAPKDDGRLVCTAALMPPAAMPAFAAALAAAPQTAIRGARDFTDLVLALDPNSTP